MTKQECLQQVRKICNALSDTDANLAISVRQPEHERDCICVVVVCHKALAQEVASGKRASYQYMVVDVGNDALAYKGIAWVREQITNAAKNVQAQYTEAA